MALLINKQLHVLGALPISELYIRFYYTVNQVGKTITVVPYVYVSRGAYDNGADSIIDDIPGIPNHLVIDYDRLEDGSDILTHIHDKFSEYLSTDKYDNLTVFDPSTHLPIYDSSTGELVTEKTITREKFAELTDITYLDLD